jgi:hypothetical protein
MDEERDGSNDSIVEERITLFYDKSFNLADGDVTWIPENYIHALQRCYHTCYIP